MESKVQELEARRYRFGAFELAASGELRKEGQPLRLPAQAARLLLLLASRAGELVTREEIVRHLWPDTVVDYDQGLHNAVRHLREALEDDPKNPRFVETVPRLGYRFIAPTEPLSPPDAAAVEAAETSRRARLFRPAWPLAVVALAAGGLVWLLWEAQAPVPRRTPPGGLPTVAVLPFEAHGSGDPQHLALGVEDGLLRELGRGARLRLRVIGRASVRHLVEQGLSPSEIAGRLGATHLVTGTVRRQGERLRVGVGLMAADDSTMLWSADYDLTAGDVFRIEREVAGRIAAELNTQLGSAAAFEPPSLDPRAMEDYLAGRFLLAEGTPKAAAAAGERFQAALSRQPSFAAAHAALGEALLKTSYTSEGAAQARRAAERALELDPGNVEALLLRGRIALFFDWSWDAASRDIRRALTLATGDWQPHLENAAYLASLARHDEAIAEAETALRLDPYSTVVQGDLAFYYFLTERHAEALAAAERMAELNPGLQKNWVLAIKLEAFFGLAREAEAREQALSLLASQGMAAPDLEELRRARGLDAVRRAYLLLQRRRLAAAPAGAQDLEGLATIHARLGEEDAALALLERIVGRRSPYLPFLAVDPHFARLRSHPRFRGLLRSAGVPAAVLDLPHSAGIRRHRR